LDLRHAVFASRYLKTKAVEAGRPVSQAEVIHWGIAVNEYPYRHAPRVPTRLLYVGQIVPHKGVHTAVEAMRLIVQQCGHGSTRLTLVGGSVVPEYDSHVRGLVSSSGLNGHVTFVGPVPRERLSSIYQEHDILIFPSVWDEPFGITLLEAMASGLAVVGTGTGGSGEILQPEVNALTFPTEDAGRCAMQILRLMEDPHLFETIRKNGRDTIEDRFRLDHAVEQLERCLFDAVAASR
jgi:glycosyltransferase involved in cell wall biosynthesis